MRRNALAEGIDNTICQAASKATEHPCDQAPRNKVDAHVDPASEIAKGCELPMPLQLLERPFDQRHLNRFIGTMFIAGYE